MMMFLGMISSASSGGQFLAAHAVAQRDGDGALGLVLAYDVFVEFANNLARGKFVQRDVFFFGGCGKINCHNSVTQFSVVGLSCQLSVLGRSPTDN